MTTIDTCCIDQGIKPCPRLSRPDPPDALFDQDAVVPVEGNHIGNGAEGNEIKIVCHNRLPAPEPASRPQGGPQCRQQIKGDTDTRNRLTRKVATRLVGIDDGIGIRQLISREMMIRDDDTAETFFAEAAERYHEFGDKVSYAYTRWAQGTLAKLQGHDDLAAEHFMAAQTLFEQTGDVRGKAYTELGEIELQVLHGVAKLAECSRRLEMVAEGLQQKGYRLEAAYTELLSALLLAQDTEPLRSRFAALGTSWFEDQLPLNIP